MTLHTHKVTDIDFPGFEGKRCLMMPYIQGDSSSVPQEFSAGYERILNEVYFEGEKGKMGYLTIDESHVSKGKAQRADGSSFERACHTEGGLSNKIICWGGPAPTWGGRINVTLDADTKVLIANNIDKSCAIWDAEHKNTTHNGDLGHLADSDYPFENAIFMSPGELWQMGIFTPHESLKVSEGADRQFLRIVSNGVHGREDHFTINRLMN